MQTDGNKSKSWIKSSGGFNVDNVILLTDSYKISHFRQYPPGTERVFSYFESRGGKYPEVVFFGLQYLLQHYLAGPVITAEKITEAETLVAGHMGPQHFNRAGWEHILHTHGGRLPVVVKAVPEGTVVPTGNAMISVENTDPSCYWLTNYLETLLVQSWYPCTVATQSRAMKLAILDALHKTGDPNSIDFKLHDFGYRGVSSVETAGLGAAAHLVNFLGTDTIAGLVLARDFYSCPTAGFSIPASEHSTITTWGKEHELDAMRNMLEQYPTGLVACVSDSFDIFRACREFWGEHLRDKILHRDGTLIIRPDSGKLSTIAFQLIEIFEILGNRFGTTINAKGFKVIDPHVRVIQGDGIDYEMIVSILDTITKAGWSADNLAFGSGGGLLQKVNRDTQKFAFKCSSATVNGVERDVFKEPVTDSGKKSKSGRLALVKTENGFATVREAPGIVNELVEVFRDGAVTRSWTLDEIRTKTMRE